MTPINVNDSCTAKTVQVLLKMYPWGYHFTEISPSPLQSLCHNHCVERKLEVSAQKEPAAHLGNGNLHQASVMEGQAARGGKSLMFPLESHCAIPRHTTFAEVQQILVLQKY